jgi:hypothetical protein
MDDLEAESNKTISETRLFIKNQFKNAHAFYINFEAIELMEKLVSLLEEVHERKNQK